MAIETYITGIRQEAGEDDGQQEAAEGRRESMAKEHDDDVLPDQSRSLPRLESSPRHCATIEFCGCGSRRAANSGCLGRIVP